MDVPSSGDGRRYRRIANAATDQQRGRARQGADRAVAFRSAIRRLTIESRKEPRMSFRWTCCALLALIPFVGVRADEKKDEVTVTKLAVEARAAPKPALKHLLIPDLRDMQPGNAVHGYLLAFMEQNHLYHSKESVANREKWLTCPLSELPDNLDYGGSSARHADYAARLD